MGYSQYRVFFDTSVYIAALLSSDGAAGELLRLAEAGVIRMIVSEEVIAEADRVLARKFPELVQENRKLWKHLKPVIAPHPSASQSKSFLEKLPRGDATILYAAKLSSPSVFVTWNTRDFLKHDVMALVDFPIVVPAECLKLFRKWLEPFLH